MLFNQNDDTIGKCLELYGEWSEPEVFLFNQIVRPGDLVVEVGSNIGTHTIPLSRLVGDKGSVYAFEPQRHTFQLLCANLALNERFNVFACQTAIGNTDGLVSFPVIPPNINTNFGGSSLRSEHGWPTEKVEIKKLDSYEFERVDFIKVDAEGFEMHVLEGACETIIRNRPVVYLEYMNHFDGDNSEKLISYFSNMKYDFWYSIVPLYNSDNFNRNVSNLYPSVHSFDLLCVPLEKATVAGMQNAITQPEVCGNPTEWKLAKFSHLVS